MAKAVAAPPPSTYVTGFCGVGNHERCPAVIKSDVGGRWWDCHCQCHQNGNSGWEPPTLTVTTETWESIWQPIGDITADEHFAEQLRDSLTKALGL